MTYETYTIPEKHLKTLQRYKAAKLTAQYVKEHGEEPPANVKAGFMDITQEDYNKYRDIFFALDFSNGMTGEGAIINTPDERPKTRYNEYVQCVYNITDTKNETKLMSSSYTNNIGYMEIDGEPVEPCSEYLFNTLGTHRIDFLMKDTSRLSLKFNNPALREIVLPECLDGLEANAFSQCSGIVKITSLAPSAPSTSLTASISPSGSFARAQV